MATARKSSVNYIEEGGGREVSFELLQPDSRSKHESNVLKVPANLTVAEIAWWAHLRSANRIYIEYTCVYV